VLGGIISPIDGIGPSDLKIDTLEEKVNPGDQGINTCPEHNYGRRHNKLLSLQKAQQI